MSAAPVRGTQSFVGIMAAVWRRPSLTLLEVLWRWLPAMLIVGVAWGGSILLGRSGIHVQLSVPTIASADLTALQNMSAFQPVTSVHVVAAAWHDFWLSSKPLLIWLVPTVFVFWNLICALGRTVVLRRLDGSLKARRGTLFVLCSLRSALLLGVWWLWVRLIVWGASTAILERAARNDDPSVVLFAAIVIVGTLLIYVLWAVVCWFLRLAPLLAMAQNVGAAKALFAALRSTRVSGKLIEINLVMNIVRLGLIVLAMVFCATPLPFTSTASLVFLHNWWAGVTLTYLAFSDYFQVVRMASYLSLYRALES